ncbi:DUF1240 domain-containing protein [Vibrio gazogenes]|uniref:DUF1240 domain-containing protein n=1 Tax=Vibrio gazogenes TaxID=687 RepID=A0A1Z2SG42_VIBGA|nr:DUF1240 domain-containing protein [Vibrio gazogenes]ASA56151.1 hypothetical protein BSQ33_10870 [Vibrio gazogenes]
MKEEVSISKLLLALLFFACFALFAFLAFGIALFQLIDNFIELPDVIEFDRGAMYGFGGGVGLSSFCIGFVILIFYRRISPKAESRIGKGIIYGLVLMFILPIFSSFTIPYLIESKGYIRCESAEYRPSWPIFRAHIYSDSQQVCKQLIEEKK